MKKKRHPGPSGPEIPGNPGICSFAARRNRAANAANGANGTCGGPNPGISRDLANHQILRFLCKNQGYMCQYKQNDSKTMQIHVLWRQTKAFAHLLLAKIEQQMQQMQQIPHLLIYWSPKTSSKCSKCSKSPICSFAGRPKRAANAANAANWSQNKGIYANTSTFTA